MGTYLTNERFDGCQTLFEKQIALSGVHLIIAVTSKSNPEKTLFTLPKNECTGNALITGLNQKEGTSVQSQDTNVKSTIHKALF